MAANIPNEKPASRKAPPSRTAGKKGTGKKKVGNKRSPPGLFSKAKHLVGVALIGAATGAVKGAVKGAVEAGGKEMGFAKEREKKGSSPKGKTANPPLIE